MRLTRMTLAILAALTVASLPSSPAAHAALSCNWTKFRDFGLPTHAGIESIAAAAANDVWVVGGFRSDNGVSYPVSSHWNGRRWREVPVPNYGELGATLQDVTALSSDDVWAVGTYQRPHTYKGFVVHWDGSAWSMVAVPRVEGMTFLKSVSAAASDDVWIVGERRRRGSPSYSVIYHWNGVEVQALPFPLDSPSPRLEDVAAVSADHAWITHGRGTITTWDGSTWNEQPFPQSGEWFSYLPKAVSSTGWVVGWDESEHPMAASWAGTEWRIVPTDPRVEWGVLNDVAGTRQRNVWAVGEQWPTGLGRGRPLVEHWNGERWHRIDAPSFEKGGLWSLDLAGRQTWALGATGGGAYLVLRWTCA